MNIKRTMTEHARVTFTVAADNPDDAADIAIELFESFHMDDVYWEVTDEDWIVVE